MANAAERETQNRRASSTIGERDWRPLTPGRRPDAGILPVRPVSKSCSRQGHCTRTQLHFLLAAAELIPRKRVELLSSADKENEDRPTVKGLSASLAGTAWVCRLTVETCAAAALSLKNCRGCARNRIPGGTYSVARPEDFSSSEEILLPTMTQPKT